MSRLFKVLSILILTVLASYRPAYACDTQAYESCVQDANPQRAQCYDDAEDWLDDCNGACDFQWPVPPGCHSSCYSGWQGKINQCEWTYAGAECECYYRHCGSGGGDICF